MSNPSYSNHRNIFSNKACNFNSENGSFFSQPFVLRFCSMNAEKYLSFIHFVVFSSFVLLALLGLKCGVGFLRQNALIQNLTLVDWIVFGDLVLLELKDFFFKCETPTTGFVFVVLV